jgi:hypothetical protein
MKLKLLKGATAKFTINFSSDEVVLRWSSGSEGWINTTIMLKQYLTQDFKVLEVSETEARYLIKSAFSLIN